jgi:hypothetical protein
MWRAIGASVLGASHSATQMRCQDYNSFVTVGTGETATLIIAVADGAGTAPSSYHGAKTAVDTSIRRITESLQSRSAIDCDFLRRIFRETRDDVLRVADEYQHPSRDYACTLLIAVANESTTVVGQLGDGAIVLDDGELRAATWPQQGEYANATHFLVQDDALDKVVLAQFSASRRIAVFSDGLQNVALRYDDQTPHEPFFAPFFSYLETSTKSDTTILNEMIAFLESKGLSSRTDDDKTLVLAVRQ